MLAAACCWFRLSGKSISISSLKSANWEILLYRKEILLDSIMLYFHPGLLMQNMPLAAGPCGQGHVKIWNHVFIYFVVAPKNWILWVECAQEGGLTGKIVPPDGFSYMN